MRILVLADDLTGAAEIAGIGWRFGMSVRLLRVPFPGDAPVGDMPAGDTRPGLTVLDTDSRPLAPVAAADRVRRFLTSASPASFDLIYKKIDSVLRGPVRAEVDAMMRALRRASATLLPQNPSRGRTIVGGVYRIDGVPLAETSFATDPEHPCHTSDVAALLGTRDPGCTIHDAATMDDVRAAAAGVKANVLPVGGADFFTALLEHRGLVASGGRRPRTVKGARLFVCGTATRQREALLAWARSAGAAVCPMPESFESAALSAWADASTDALKLQGRCVMWIGPAGGAESDRAESSGSSMRGVESGGASHPLSDRLLDALSSAATRVIERTAPAMVLLEGGATASAVSQKSGWQRFDVAGEWAPGVVQLTPGDATPQGVQLVMKPGSYPWPGELLG